MNKEWIENTGTVPDGVTADTHIEVFLREFGPMIWRGVFAGIGNDDPELWTLGGDAFDIIRWRFV